MDHIGIDVHKRESQIYMVVTGQTIGRAEPASLTESLKLLYGLAGAGRLRPRRTVAARTPAVDRARRGG